MLAFGMVGNVKAGVLDSLQLRARVGYNIGGTAPIPMPETIRSIDSYTLTPSFMVGVDALLPLSPKWGISLGVHFENKGMDGDVTTKSYQMEVVKGNSKLSGRFTGHVSQQVKQETAVKYRFPGLLLGALAPRKDSRGNSAAVRQKADVTVCCLHFC